MCLKSCQNETSTSCHKYYRFRGVCDGVTLLLGSHSFLKRKTCSTFFFFFLSFYNRPIFYQFQVPLGKPQRVFTNFCDLVLEVSCILDCSLFQPPDLGYFFRRSTDLVTINSFERPVLSTILCCCDFRISSGFVVNFNVPFENKLSLQFLAYVCVHVWSWNAFLRPTENGARRLCSQRLPRFSGVLHLVSSWPKEKKCPHFSF